MGKNRPAYHSIGDTRSVTTREVEIMARSIPESFYKEDRWKRCREDFLKSKRWLCEDCLKENPHDVNPATIAHHVIWLNRTNYRDPSIAYNWDNLRALCDKHHNRIHHGKSKKRYRVDKQGNLIITG